MPLDKPAAAPSSVAPTTAPAAAGAAAGATGGPDAARVASNLAAGGSPAGDAPAELFLTRLFKAPRRLVFETWAKPEHLVRWWGPKDFTLPTCEVDFRPGGVLRFCMRSPWGDDHWMEGTFDEIVEPERIVFSVTIEGEPPGRQLLTTAVFTEEEGGTRLTLRQMAPTDPNKARGQKQGWTESLDRLDDHLAGL